MPSHNSVAKSVRLDKEAHPEKYCPEKKCLWRTGDGSYCPNHGGALADLKKAADELGIEYTDSYFGPPRV